MKFCILLLTSFFLACIGNAQATTRLIFPDLEDPVEYDLGPGCHARIKKPKNSEFPISHGSGSGKSGGTLILHDLKFIPGDWFFSVLCYELEDDVVQRGWAIAKNGKRWGLNKNMFDNDPSQLERTRFLQMAANNFSGWVVVVDDVMGDERYRQRRIYYCLTHEKNALCGEGSAGYLRNITRNKDSDLTPSLLKFLKSIEFLSIQAVPEQDLKTK